MLSGGNDEEIAMRSVVIAFAAIALTSGCHENRFVPREVISESNCDRLSNFYYQKYAQQLLIGFDSICFVSSPNIDLENHSLFFVRSYPNELNIGAMPGLYQYDIRT